VRPALKAVIELHDEHEERPAVEGTPQPDRISGIEAVDKDRSATPVPNTDSPVMQELGLRSGALVDGIYRIVRPLGAGGMGVVTLAHDERLDRQVAIKFIRPELFENRGLRDLFEIEARAMARVSHANVLTVHSFGEHDGVPYFVMEYVEGPTVEDWLGRRVARGAPPDVDEAMRLLDQICQGVEAIHLASTVHRDLKPSNLLMSGEIVDEQLRVAVSDLGVARIIEGAGAGSGASCIVGSAQYMAPEAALGNDTNPELATRRDIYALGRIAFELLVGRPPFAAPNDIGLMSKHLLESPPAATSLRPDLPPGYDDVLLRALDKDPLKRPASAAELRRLLLAVHERDHDPKSILVADDDEDWRELVRRALAKRFPDARIDVVHDGKEAIEKFDEHPYCVVLLDLEMPAVDGIELTARLRARDESQATPLIVMTAAGGPGEWRRLSQLGADGFLVKPIDPEDIAALIRRAMRTRSP
jgi:eukaryotic-like serine/threonine-protein kinase